MVLDNFRTSSSTSSRISRAVELVGTELAPRAVIASRLKSSNRHPSLHSHFGDSLSMSKAKVPDAWDDDWEDAADVRVGLHLNSDAC